MQKIKSWKKSMVLFFYKKLILLLIFDFNNKVNIAYCKLYMGKLKSEAKEEIKWLRSSLNALA